MEKALIIRGEIKDLSEIVRIARVEGKKALKVDKVRVKPFLACYGNESYMVVVEPEKSNIVPRGTMEGSCCSKSSGAGGKRHEH